MTHELLAVRDRRAWAFVRLTRPGFWPLDWGGAYLGSVLATRAWVPPAGSVPASVAAFLMLGPPAWSAVLTVNDLHDLPSDRVNPRKATAPLVTGVLDRAADRAAGDITVAVRWRPESCYRAGLALWIGATVLWLATCYLGVLVQRESWWFQTVTAPALVVIYAIMARRPSIPRMAVVAVAFGIPATEFLIACVGSGSGVG
jgi:4-hydroxybenzoate polyprenyltransferase